MQTYFAVQFDVPFTTYGAWSGEDITKAATTINGTDIHNIAKRKVIIDF